MEKSLDLIWKSLNSIWKILHSYEKNWKKKLKKKMLEIFRKTKKAWT